jgi:sulfate transport system substrate-binding protein
VADGLEADVVTMNQSNDIEFLADKGLVAKDWAKKFPNNASPYTSTMVFIVRKGNPKAIKDWSDLPLPGMQVIIPHPKNTGNGRNTYLSAWAWALKQPGGNDAKAQEFLGKLLEECAAVRRRWARRDDDLHAAQDGRRADYFRIRSRNDRQGIRQG